MGIVKATAFMAVISVACFSSLFATPLPAQNYGGQVAIGHNRLVFINPVLDNTYGVIDIPPEVQLGTRCGDPPRPVSCSFPIPPFPHQGIILWINDDSGWQPDPAKGWQPLQPNESQTVSIAWRKFRVYLLPYDPGQEQGWHPSDKFVFVPYPNRSAWEEQQKQERELTIYIDEYAYYWQLCRNDTNLSDRSGNQCQTCCYQDPNGRWYCWVWRDGWDGTPDRTGQFGAPYLCGWFYFAECPPANRWVWNCETPRAPFQNGAQCLFRGKVATVPLCSQVVQSADAALDNRPVCPDLEQPPTYAKFGKYTYLGGLFVGQVPWWYGQHGRWQQAPDLSGTGRTLLKFYNPDGFPLQVDAACLSLVYTATPNAVALSYSQSTKAIGVRIPSDPSNPNWTNWQEDTVSWLLIEQLNLQEAFGDNGWVGSTKWLSNEIRPSDDADPVDQNGNLIVHSELGWRTDTINRVVIPLRSWSAQGQFVSLLLALHPEAPPIQNPATSPIWYYFLSKDHPLTTGRTCPRLWYVVRLK